VQKTQTLRHMSNHRHDHLLTLVHTHTHTHTHTQAETLKQVYDGARHVEERVYSCMGARIKGEADLDIKGDHVV
jgi:homoserine trans-succinylase